MRPRSPLSQHFVVALHLVALTWALAFIVASSFVAIDGRRYFCLFDDAMISMRYAWNLVHGNGLVWSVGERVEGFTNFLMVMVMAMVQLFVDGRGAVLLIQLFGLLTAALTGWLCWRVSESFGTGGERGKRLGAAVSVFLLLTYYPFWYWPLMGMETGLLTLLLLWAVGWAIRMVRHQESQLALKVGLLCALVSLTRPDALLFSVTLLLYVVVGIKAGRQKRLEVAGSLLLGFAPPLLALMAFRAWYFGELFPNTYLLKVSGIPLSTRLSGGWAFVKPFLSDLRFGILLVLTALLNKFSRERALAFLFFIEALLYQVYVGGEPWPYWRLLVPVLPLLFAVIGSEVARLAAVCEQRVKRAQKRWVHTSAMAALSLVLAVNFNGAFRDHWSLDDIPGRSGNRHFVNVAVALRQVLKPTATIGLFRAGTTPYYLAPWRAVDFLGKSDRHIAKTEPHFIGAMGMATVPGHNKYDLTYSVIEKLPTYIEHYMWLDDNVREKASPYYVWARVRGVRLLLRRDSPDVDWAQVEGVEPI